MEDADAVHGFGGAEELDGEEHCYALVQGACCVARSWIGFGEVDEVEESALVEVGFY